jgi:hypothetical protein
VYRVYGHPLRGTLYPPRVVLFRKDFATYKNDGHTQRVVVATAFCGEVVQHGRNGWVLPEITPLSITAILREFVQDPSRLQAASDRSELDERFDGRQWLRVLE